MGGCGCGREGGNWIRYVLYFTDLKVVQFLGWMRTQAAQNPETKQKTNDLLGSFSIAELISLKWYPFLKNGAPLVSMTPFSLPFTNSCICKCNTINKLFFFPCLGCNWESNQKGRGQNKKISTSKGVYLYCCMNSYMT